MNLSLLTDLYELTMMQGYYFYKPRMRAVFDMLYRSQPFGGGYAVFAGLEPLLRAVLELRFSREDIAYLRGLGLFREEFLEYLSRFRFSGDIYAMEEGAVVFPREPLVRVHGTIMEAQLVESLLLNILNFQTLIATKAARIAGAAKGRGVMEFGLRRAQGTDGALAATRASFIGGAASTSNVLAGKRYGIPVAGTMAHSWVMSFASERESFAKYARLYPGHTTLLIDTYDTLRNGIGNAIAVFRQLKKRGVGEFGVRLDSGDLEYLSKRIRARLDAAGLPGAKIVASNELDEEIIEELLNRDAPVDYFGVGTKLVTAQGTPALNGIYKLVARCEASRCAPSIKISNTPEKTTTPHVKNVLRIFNDDGTMAGDLIFLESERASLERSARRRQPLELYHPEYSYEKVTLSGYSGTEVLLRQVVAGGRLVTEFPSIRELQARARENLMRLHSSHKRLLNPHLYKVSLTRRLKEMKQRMIARFDTGKGVPAAQPPVPE